MPPVLTAVLVPAMPAASFALLAVLRRRLGERAGFVAVAALAVSLASAVSLLVRVLTSVPEEPLVHAVFPWAVVGGRPLDFGLLIDGLSASMMVMVGIVALMVVTYAIGYMHGDERFAWFFAVISLFTASMFGLVSGSSLLQIMLFWEVMGLCSYLLIGFWYERPEARSASIKAFLTTRVGDMGFLAGVILLYGRFHTLDLPALFRLAEEAHGDQVFLTVACLLLFVGAVGKSAQFPLYFWLPHAMAGPTPVSGLLHSATMVAAGVFLIARTYPLFEAAHYALPFIAAAGMFSATFGALLALTETDIKRTLAYSTMSQLGYMMGALGVGGLVGAVFHLITHAFFKSLLFLGAGSVIHGTGTQDVREMGGLYRKMPKTAVTFLIATCAIAGLPPLAGFFSKDAILAALWSGKTVSQPLAVLLFIGGLATAVLTAFYMFRLYFTVFLGEEKSHAHESPAFMTTPLIVLAGVTVVAGGINLPWGRAVLGGLVAPGETETFVWWLMVLSILAGGAGVYVAWSQHATRLGAVYGLERYVVYDKGKGHRLERLYGWAFIKPVFALSEFLRNLDFDRLIAALVVDPVFRVSDRLRAADIDTVYTAVFVSGVTKAAEGFAAFDGNVIDRGIGSLGTAGVGVARALTEVDTGAVDRAVDGVAAAVQRLGRGLRRLQTGFVANYALLMLALGALIFYLAVILTRGQS